MCGFEISHFSIYNDTWSNAGHLLHEWHQDVKTLSEIGIGMGMKCLRLVGES